MLCFCENGNESCGSVKSSNFLTSCATNSLLIKSWLLVTAPNWRIRVDDKIGRNQEARDSDALLSYSVFAWRNRRKPWKTSVRISILRPENIIRHFLYEDSAWVPNNYTAIRSEKINSINLRKFVLVLTRYGKKALTGCGELYARGGAPSNYLLAGWVDLRTQLGWVL
jgi:hypothetical protein